MMVHDSIPVLCKMFHKFILNNYGEILKLDDIRYHKLFRKNFWGKINKINVKTKDIWCTQDDVYVMLNLESYSFGTFFTVKISLDDINIFNIQNVSLEMFNCEYQNDAVFKLSARQIGDYTLQTI